MSHADSWSSECAVLRYCSVGRAQQLGPAAAQLPSKQYMRDVCTSLKRFQCSMLRLTSASTPMVTQFLDPKHAGSKNRGG